MASVRRVLKAPTSYVHHSKRNRPVASTVLLSDFALSETKSINDIPGPPQLPIIGGLVNYLPLGKFYKKSPEQVYKMCRSQYGNIYKEKLLHYNFVHLFEPNDFATIFRSDGNFPVREAFTTLKYYNEKYNNGVQGILTSQKETWHELRSNFQQKMLKPKAVTAYFDCHADAADDLVQNISRSQEENIIEDLREDLDRFAAECVGLVCFNKKFNLLSSQEENLESREFFSAVNVIMETSHHEYKQLPIYRLFETPSFKKFVQAQNKIKEIAVRYSKQALERLESQSKESSLDGENGDLIPYLMSKQSLTTEKVLTVISELIFSGVDTTSHHLSFMLYLLGNHPQVQENLYKEIVYIAGNDSVKCDEIQKMSYLKAVDKEVHRLLPVAMGTIRKLNQDVEIQGYKLPAGTTVVTHWYASAKDSDNFSNAKSFRPERWLRDNVHRKNVNSFAFLPFGFGQRSCIGKRFSEQETFLAIVKILQKYEVEYIGDDLELDYGVTAAPVNKMKFRFIPRSQT